MLRRSHIQRLLTSTTIGAVFAGIYSLSRPTAHGRIIAAGALTGALIFFWIELLEQIFDARIDRLGAGARAFVKALLFLAGGVLGWTTGMTLALPLFGVGWAPSRIFDAESALLMAITSAVAIAVGLAFYVFQLLRLRLERTLEQLKDREWAEKELELARSIQARLLPPALVEGDGYRIEARNLPARVVAGDFYDVVPLEDGSVVIVVADVAGKGVGASLIMASVKAVLPFVARDGGPRAMSMLNAKLVQELGRREFVALAYARLTPANGSVELLNAGFPDPYIVSSSGVRVLVTAGERLPLGVRAGIGYEPLTTTLAPGERLVFLSDGIPEAPVNGEPLGYERLGEMLAHVERASGRAPDGRAEARPPFVDRLLEEVRNAGATLDDDWTAVVVERRNADRIRA